MHVQQQSKCLVAARTTSTRLLRLEKHPFLRLSA